jgi:glycosyltransferase involved in cell wall biosynthesis
MNILNILYFSPEVGGGIVKHLVTLGKVAKSKGHNLVLGFTKKRDWQTELQVNSQVIIIPEIEKPLRSGFPKILREICRLHSIDIIHFHFLFALPFSLSFSFWQRKLPVIYHWHNPPTVLNEFVIPKNKLAGKLKRFYSGLVARITDKRVIVQHITISREITGLLIKNKWTRPEKITFLQNGISIKDSGNIFAKIKTNNLPIIGMVANFRAQKDHRTLLTAFSILLKTGIKAELWLVGDGPTKSLNESFAKKMGIESSVRFLGTVSDLSKIYKRFDVFVLSTHYEGHPLAILEAMSYGLPIVATRISSIPEIITDGENGLLVNTNDPTHLAQGIQKLLTDKSLYDRLSEAAFKTIKKQHTVDDWARNLLSLYEREVTSSI